MGTYDDLMQLGEAPKKASPPKPKSSLPKVAVSSIPQPVTDGNKAEVPDSLKRRKVSKETGKSNDTTPPRHHATVASRKGGITQPWYHTTMIETIRAAVKEFGKEAATHRFTPDEKRALTDIVYIYKMSGIKTSENEIVRIAVNFLVADYKEHGESSVLSHVLKALNG